MKRVSTVKLILSLEVIDVIVPLDSIKWSFSGRLVNNLSDWSVNSSNSAIKSSKTFWDFLKLSIISSDFALRSFISASLQVSQPDIADLSFLPQNGHV